MSPDSGRLRLTLAGVVVLALFGAMMARLWYLQVLDAPSFQRAAVSNQVRTVTVDAPRGQILDRNGDVLVDNRTVEVVTLQRSAATRHPEVVGRLAAVLNEPIARIDEQLSNQQYSVYRPVPIQTDVSPDTVVYLKEHHNDFPGVDVSLQSERNYTQGDSAAQLLGYTGDVTSSELAKLAGKGYQQGDTVGKDGVEAGYEQYLRGTPGTTKLEVNAQGQVVGTLSTTPPVPGHDVQLTLDLGLQQELEKDLQNQIKSLHGTYDSSNNGTVIPTTSGAAVVLDPQNGQVLAMASYPSYDPSEWVGGISKTNFAALNDPANSDPLLNRAIAGLYTPGSTFKIATATAALDKGLITPSDYIDDPGSFTVPHCTAGQQCTYKDAPGEHGSGNINVVTAITQSSDVFFYNLGYDFWAQSSKYGQTPIQDTAAAYGLGQDTGIGIPGASKHSRVDSQVVRQYLHLADPKAFPNATWFAGDNIEMAFGQGGTFITPLQLANAYATFANGGTRYRPEVAARVVDQSGATSTAFSPDPLAHVDLPASTRDPMLQGFEGVPVDGTAAGAFVGFPLSQFPVAGKTGTATTNHVEPNSLFAAFAPADNPQYAIAVIIDQGGYGATASAPVARQVLDYLRTHPIGPVQAARLSG